MFEKTKAFTGYSVDDVAEARRFYAQTLGVRVTDNPDNELLITLELQGGDRPTLVYQRPNHVPAEYTVLNFNVDDVEAAVDGLAAKGVEFERYDGMPQDEKGIMRGNGPDIAWFTDPAGNVIAVLDGD
jgi:catechol 2,3-dioxygenase-like lactoylglutathione lyase family enzyme